MHRLRRRPDGAAAPLGLRFWLFYIINVYGYSLYIPYIFHIYFLAMFHIFSLVCFLIYGVKSRSGHDRSQSFGSILYVSGPKLSFWGSFSMERCNFWRKKKEACFADKDLSSWTGLGRSGHDRSQSFGQISHVSGLKLSFWCNFQMILHGFAWRN